MKKRKLLFWIIGIGSGAGAIFFLLFAKWNTPKKWKETQVERGKIDRVILATGTVQPENRVEIKSPVGGRMEEVRGKQGDIVKKGQIVAVVSSTERSALLDAARARGSNEVKEWEAMYRPSPILAPISGMIIQRNIEIGQTITPADAIFVLSDRLTIKTLVDETDLAQIRVEQKAMVVLDAYPDKKIPSKVIQIAYDAKTVNNVTTYTVDVLPEKISLDKMRSGMTANVSFEMDSKEDILILPVEVVRYTTKEPKVLVLENGKQVERTIATGISDGKKVEVLSGLKENDTILSADLSTQESKNRAYNPFSPNTSPKSRKEK